MEASAAVDESLLLASDLSGHIRKPLRRLGTFHDIPSHIKVLVTPFDGSLIKGLEWVTMSSLPVIESLTNCRTLEARIVRQQLNRSNSTIQKI